MTAETIAPAYPSRRRSKGGRVVHATRLVESGGVGRHVGACGTRADAELPEPADAPVTCRACQRALAPQH